MSKQINLIYIGGHFYMQSGTAMSCIYTEDGQRFDWGLVQTAVARGATVNIRPATDEERAPYEARLANYRKLNN